ncbi:DMT family transporter [Curvivirga sp.]|uniref:DMT family transporter n=1 Tax=Curvivirga sp. TaxID=2856848 RepID=UPI003B5B604F
MPQNQNVYIAALWTAGALISFMIMAVGGREAATELNTFQILFFRSIVGFIIVSALLSYFGWEQIRTTKLKLHIFRNLAHYVGQYGWFFGIAVIPLAEVFAIEFTTPIWIAVMAVMFLGEKLTPSKIIAITLGFAGILIIIKPGAEIINYASLAVLISAIGYAIAHSMTKHLTAYDSPLCIIFYMIAIQLPISFFPALDNWVWPSLYTWFWLVILGSTALSAHYCLAHAFRHADATVVVPMDFMRLPLVTAVGYLVYNESVDVWLFIGAFVTLCGNMINVRAAKRGEIKNS